MWSTVFFIIVLLHLLAGFGYLIYKLSPFKKVVDVKVDTRINKTIDKTK